VEEQDKMIFDGIAGSVTLGAFFQFLPSLTAFFSLIWVVIRIFETDTVQGLLGLRNDD
jgi:hypothetical protein